MENKENDKSQEHSESGSSVVIPEYLSKTYYSVILGTQKYKGWKAEYVGCGRMLFVHNDYGSVFMNKGASQDWMVECWNDFIGFTSRIEKV